MEYRIDAGILEMFVTRFKANDQIIFLSAFDRMGEDDICVKVIKYEYVVVASEGWKGELSR